MSLKEFDAKQFLLEKGEQVGLGVALTLMVVMLVVSLFLPSRGFMSGSPEAKAQPLADGSKTLDTALRSRELPEQERPPKAEDRLIALDTNGLRLDLYATGPWFEPAAPENPARQPPTILTLAEAKAAFACVPIDTYIFDKKFTRIMVLNDQDKSKATPNNNPAAGRGNLARQYKGAPGMLPGGQATGAAKNFGNAAFQQGLQGIQAADERKEYRAELVSLDKLSGSERLARQLEPARMVLIEGSFPYKEQLEEFRRKLRLDTIQDVLDETVDKDKDEKEKLYAFRFLGVDVERREVDANDKPVGNWKKLKLAEQYKIWLMNSGEPFEPDDPKYDSVKPLEGLAMPLLREFHEEGPGNPTGTMVPGMRRPGAPGVPGVVPPRPDTSRADEPRKAAETNYPDLAKEMKTIQSTLAKMAEVGTERIATQAQKFRPRENFNPFSSNASVSEAENPATTGAPRPKGKEGEQAPSVEVPDYCLVRLVDIDDIKPGKSYRYRIRVRMANPNYNRDDVASAAYKLDKELESRDWYDKLPTVHVPFETIYYAVDEKQINKDEKHPPQSPLYDMWKDNKEQDRRSYVCFQLHRWLESAQIGDTPTPVGDWAIADRVFVARGETVGRTVKVDVPVWKYTRDSFILPAEDQSTKRDRRLGRTGVYVNFGQDNPENETLLLDFEGGRVSEGKVSDTCAVEVLMLSPDGRLLARNSATDANDKTRQDRRKKVLEHIEAVRAGKTSGVSGPAGGGLDK